MQPLGTRSLDALSGYGNIVGNPVTINQNKLDEEVEDKPLLEKMKLFKEKYISHEKPIGEECIEDVTDDTSSGRMKKVVPMETNEDLMPAIDAEDEKWWNKYNSTVSNEDWLFYVTKTATKDWDPVALEEDLKTACEWGERNGIREMKR